MNREERRRAEKNKIGKPQVYNHQISSNFLADALSLHKSGKLEQAKVLYEQFLLSEPENCKALNYLGVLQGQMGNVQAAICLLTKAVELAPDNFGYLNNLGNFYRTTAQLDKAIACYQKAIVLNPNSADSQLNLGIAFTEQKMVNEAIAAFEEAIKLNPLQPRAYITLGDILQTQGDLEYAIASYAKAIALQPNSFEALSSLGMAFYRKGDLQESQQAYEHALNLNPFSTDVLTNMGATFYEQGNMDMAAACYREVINIKPTSADAYVNLGFLFVQIGKYSEAIDSYNQALKYEPQLLRAMIGVAEVLANQSKWDETIEIYRRILEINPESADTYANLGIALKTIGDLEGAIAQFERAITIDTRHIKAYAHLGLAFQETINNEAETNQALSTNSDLEAYQDHGGNLTPKSILKTSIFDFGLVTKYQFMNVEGWQSLDDYNLALRQYVYKHPTLLRDRIGKPTNKGRQTYEIFSDRDRVMVTLRSKIDAYLHDYFQHCVVNSLNPFFQDAPAKWRLSGWAVVLESDGFQTPHIHPESFCSGVYYIQIPNGMSDSNTGAGNLSFGELFPQESEKNKITQFTIQPQEGLLVLFPSYFWHSTIPFTVPSDVLDKESDRICISFNVIPV